MVRDNDTSGKEAAQFYARLDDPDRRKLFAAMKRHSSQLMLFKDEGLRGDALVMEFRPTPDEARRKGALVKMLQNAGVPYESEFRAAEVPWPVAGGRRHAPKKLTGSGISVKVKDFRKLVEEMEMPTDDPALCQWVENKLEFFGRARAGHRGRGGRIK